MADKPNDISNEESSPVPSIKVDLVQEAKSCGPELKIEKAEKEPPQNQTFKFAPSTPLFGSTGSSTFRSFSSFGSKMSGDKPSTSFGNSPLRASFLRPPQLASPEKFGSSTDSGENSTKCSFALKPARLNNPFAPAASEKVESAEVPGESSSSDEKQSQPAASLPKFVPLGTPLPPSQQRVSSAPPAPRASTSAAIGFVFGQNLHEKVSDADKESGSEKSDAPEAVNNGASSSSTMVGSNGTSENLFTSVLKKEQGDKNNDSGGEGSERPSKSLSEAAKEYEESRAVKRKYEEVAVVTGEEDEINILQINCKLFAFDKVKASWVERGRGNLRLNDKDTGPGQKQSRIIMRTTGSFRVVLNTKLWPGMVVEKVSTKSVRLTAMDANSGEILIFLVVASPKDSDFLFNYLDSRLTTLKASCADSASSYPDASRKNNVNCSSASASEPEDYEETQTKKRAVDGSENKDKTNHVSKSDSGNKDSQDTGGSEDSSVGKNSSNEITTTPKL